jgi:ribonuclease Z
MSDKGTDEANRWRKWTPGGAGAALLVTIGGTVGYLNRERLVDRAIRRQLAALSEPAFTAEPDQFQVLLCGTGSPQLSAAKAQACTLVGVGGKIFVFDVGEGATKSMADSGVALPDIDRVFITHFHSDHFNGLGTLINQSWTWGRTEALEVIGPVGTREVVGAINAAYRIDNGFRRIHMARLEAVGAAAQARPQEIEFPGTARSVRIYDQDGVSVDAHLVVHDPVTPALGYVIQYAGKKVFISGDTEVSPQNMPAMRDADLVVHEAYAAHLVRRALPVMREMGLSREVEIAEQTMAYHADTRALAEQAQQAHVKHLALTHLAPYPDTALKRYLFVRGMSDRYSGRITVGQDGMVITV